MIKKIFLTLVVMGMCTACQGFEYKSLIAVQGGLMSIQTTSKPTPKPKPKTQSVIYYTPVCPDGNCGIRIFPRLFR